MHLCIIGTVLVQAERRRFQARLRILKTVPRLQNVTCVLAALGDPCLLLRRVG